MNTRTNTSADEGGSTDFVSGGGGGGASFRFRPFLFFLRSSRARASSTVCSSTQQSPSLATACRRCFLLLVIVDCLSSSRGRRHATRRRRKPGLAAGQSQSSEMSFAVVSSGINNGDELRKCFAARSTPFSLALRKNDSSKVIPADFYFFPPAAFVVRARQRQKGNNTICDEITGLLTRATIELGLETCQF